MLVRHAVPLLKTLQTGYPIIAITGPRQSGKSTFATHSTTLPFINLEDPVELARHRADLHGLFASYPNGAIIDEAQHLPELFPALQAHVDAHPVMGRWIITGSQNFALSQRIGQSLAGRAATIEMLPFSHAELADSPRCPPTLAQAIFHGGYAPLYDLNRQLETVRWLNNYIAHFINRDITGLIGVRKLSTFTTFMGLCASLSGSEINNAKLATILQVDGKTIEEWLSALESAYVIIRLRPYFRNFGKRLVKRPKIYFLDTGLACRLMQINDVEQLRSHPLWGNLVETWCVSEILKSRLNRGQPPQLAFWRTSDGHEVDVVIDLGHRIIPIEIKSNHTASHELARGLVKLRRIAQGDKNVNILPGLVIYGGDREINLHEDRTVPWHAIDAAIAQLR
jgi:uncharacterized protein